MLKKASILKRYLPQGEFSELAVLLHGIFLFGHVMIPLAKHLQKDGCAAFIYDYPSRLKHIDGHGRDFAEVLRSLIRSEPGKKIHLVTHSLGGIITRYALDSMTEEERAPIGRIVQIVPPNQGSDIAKWVTEQLPVTKSINAVLPDLSCAEDSPIHRIAPIYEGIPFGILEARYDTSVRESYYHLPGAQDYLMLPSTHTGILFRSEAAYQVSYFLKNSRFDHEHAAARLKILK